MPTGTPPGICAVASRASSPRRPPSRGTPKTGRAVAAAVTPAKCAAIPAPQMKTCVPAASACATQTRWRSGVRWAETTRARHSTPSSSKTEAAASIAFQSDLLPIQISTRAPGPLALFAATRRFAAPAAPLPALGRALGPAFAVFLVAIVALFLHPSRV